MCKVDCYGEQEGGTGLIGTGRVPTSREVDDYSGSRTQRKTWLGFAEGSLWMRVSLRGIEKSFNSSPSHLQAEVGSSTVWVRDC